MTQDPDPPEVTGHSKHDFTPNCRNLSSQYSWRRIFLSRLLSFCIPGQPGGQHLHGRGPLDGSGLAVEHDWLSCHQSCPSECSDEFPELPATSFWWRNFCWAWIRAGYWLGWSWLIAHFYPTTVLVFFPSLQDLIAFLQLHGHHRDQALQRGRPGSGVEVTKGGRGGDKLFKESNTVKNWG